VLPICTQLSEQKLALTNAGVELLAQGSSFGAGVRWKAPRERR
jgi:hypothetical protein